MTKDRFFDAFGQIEPTYVLAAGDILYSGKEVRMPPVRAVHTILIAAAIAVLMTLTAYAAGWFGLSDRLINAPGEHTAVSSGEAAEILDTLRPIHHRDYISLSGVAGSPEYQAAAEWLAFRGSYADMKSAEQLDRGESYYEWRDLERGFASDAQAKEICRLYQVWDAAMWEKLQEIAARYGLSLHTARTLIPGDLNQSRDYGRYEDGSFTVSAAAEIEQKSYMYDFYFERDGYIPCDDMVTGGTDEYAEWEYTNAHGQSVSIAVRDVSTNASWRQYDFLIFCSANSATMTVSARYGYPVGDTADEKLFMEQLADSIDFASVAAAGTPEEALAILGGAV